MELHEFFKPADWIVVAGYLLLTTWVGHRLRGSQATIRDFFLGGRSLPWPAVSGSIIATEISGVTFIGVPGMLLSLHLGDFKYLQWAIGSILARIVVGCVFVRVFYEREIYSPYDYMGQRLGSPVKKLATILFTIGSILAQSVRVLVAALPLKVVTPLPFEWCIVAIGIFAILWTLMGGMTTVIWTDVMQFGLFILGGTVALFWAVHHLPGGWGEFWTTASEADKLKVFDFTRGFTAELEFTFWVAVFAVPFLNLNAFGVDQLNAQRMFCCKSPSDARKAIIFSSFGQIVTLLMLMVGAALWVFYQVHPPIEQVASFAGYDPATGNATAGDNVFPAWIVTQLPTGLRGLILAGVFAAAISSLDSILAALSQTTLSFFYNPENTDEAKGPKNLLWISRGLVVFWGAGLVGFALLLDTIREQVPILSLAFGMTAYTVGPMLAIFICSMRGRASFAGILVGTVISVFLTMCVRTDFANILIHAIPTLLEPLSSLPTFVVNDAGTGLKSVYSYVWMWPITFFITFAFGTLFAATSSRKID
ncbi:MAG: sodium/solute symporter [Verrucomicrobiota bacterium]